MDDSIDCGRIGKEVTSVRDILLPSLGESVTECLLVHWLKEVGELVERNEPIAEMSTDKVNVEIAADDAGTLTEILVPAGQTVTVGTVIARIEER